MLFVIQSMNSVQLKEANNFIQQITMLFKKDTLRSNKACSIATCFSIFSTPIFYFSSMKHDTKMTSLDWNPNGADEILFADEMVNSLSFSFRSFFQCSDNLCRCS